MSRLIILFSCMFIIAACRKQPAVPKNIDPFAPLNNYIVGKWQRLDEVVDGYPFYIDANFVGTKQTIGILDNDTDAYHVKLVYVELEKNTPDENKILFEFTKDELTISNQTVSYFTNVTQNHDTTWKKASLAPYHLKRNESKSTLSKINVTAYAPNGEYFELFTFLGLSGPTDFLINKIDTNHLYLTIDGRYKGTQYNYTTHQYDTISGGHLEEYRLERVQ